MLLLHGWTGDENSMWIFTPRLPENYIIISPRGIFQTPLGGYGWRENSIKGWSTMNDFQPAMHALIDLIDSLGFPGNQSKRFNVMGFSQGAALAYSLALTYPEKVDKLAGISGFFPELQNGALLDGALKGKKVFVAHGLRDEMVPVDKARQVVKALKKSGAEVTYCEEDVGHKLSSGCFRGMDDFFGA
jgi:phospholipase/carboxylesterase